jgi:hypothetical protein
MIAPRPTAGCVAPPAINHTRTEALKAAKGGNPAAD